MAYRLARCARHDVLNIWRRIAEDNESAADRFIDLLAHHFGRWEICLTLAGNGMTCAESALLDY